MAIELSILIILFLFSVPPLLVRKFKNDKYFKRKFWQFGDYNLLMYSLLALFALVITLNVFSPQPDLSTADKKIEFGRKRSIPEYEQAGYEQKLLADPANLLYHIRALELRCKHFSGRKSTLTYFDNIISDPSFHYDDLLKSANEDIKDAGHFGHALLYIFRSSSSVLAEDHLGQITNQNKPGIQFARALIAEFEDDETAASFHRKEILNNGNVEQSTEWLSRYYFRTAQYLSLINLNADSHTKNFVPLHHKQFLAFRNNHYLDFLILEFEYCFTKWNLPGIMGALFIFVVWLVYILKIDLFERERRRHLFAAIFISSIFTLLISYYYHWQHYYLEFYQDGEWKNDLLYYIFGVGLPEEICKLIPFFLILVFTKAINEPLDYMVFGAVSALSFAFVENTFYFDENGIYNIHTRALWTSVTHAADTCIITYCMMYPKWHPRAKGIWKNNYFMFFFGLMIASFSHGLYDFFWGEQFSEFWIVPFLITLTSIVVFTSMINNCLNNSPFHTKDRNINTDKLGSFLAASLLAVILFEYVCISFIYGIETGNNCLIFALLTSWYLLMFLAVRLTGIDILNGRWEKLRFFASINPVAMILFKKVNYNSYIGQEIVINAGRRNAPILKLLPIKGKITRREVVSDHTGWLVVDSDKSIVVRKKEYKQFWIRTHLDDIPLLNNTDTEIRICVLPEESEKIQFKTEADLIFLDRVLVHGT